MNEALSKITFISPPFKNQNMLNRPTERLPHETMRWSCGGPTSTSLAGCRKHFVNLIVSHGETEQELFI